MTRIYILSILVIAVLCMAIWKPTNAYFTDTVISGNNVFATASEFPSTQPSEPTDESTPTPSVSSITQPGDVVINEIMWMGSSISGADEWIELRNTTDKTIDLSNWVLEYADSPHITFPAGSSIGPEGYYLISNYTKDISHIDVDPDLISTSVNLLNTGEQLILKDNSGFVVDTANTTSGWLAGDNSTVKRSMSRKNPAGDGTSGNNWQNATTQVNLDIGSSDLASPKAANGF